MKPTPTYNKFLLWMHATIIVLNTLTFSMNVYSGKPFVAGCNFIVICCFLMMGMSNFQKFFAYRKEMKAYKIEQTRLEMKRIEAAFLEDAKKKKAQELKDKFSYF